MKRQHPADLVESYLEHAVRGERRPAIRCALDLFDSGVPEEQVVVGLLAAAQRKSVSGGIATSSLSPTNTRHRRRRRRAGRAGVRVGPVGRVGGQPGRLRRG